MAKTTDPAFRSPMLAMAATELPPGRTHIAEEKLDGWRLIVAVRRSIAYPSGILIAAWTRTGNSQKLPNHVLAALSKLPDGVYDGEIMIPGKNSSDVNSALAGTYPALAKKLRYVLFDLLEYRGQDMVSQPYHKRREALTFAATQHLVEGALELIAVHSIKTWDDVERLAEQVWLEKGEGLIVKDINARYEPGKRRKSFLKIKQCISTAADGGKGFKIIGFAPSEGEVNGYGDFGTAVLVDGDGVIIPVKVLDDEVRVRLAKADNPILQMARAEGGNSVWQTKRLLSGKKITFHTNHPFVGKLLHIEYQQRTVDGSYRHPRWDRLDGE